MPILVIDSGNHKGQKLVLPPDAEQEFLLGRDESANLRIDDKRASRLHCRVRFDRERRLLVEDLESRNGTYLNSSQISRPEMVSVGDQITIGDTVITVLPDAEAAHPADPFEGRDIGGYSIGERVGRGGMGTVYRAVQKSLGREVALKILSPQLADDPERIRNFVNEARAAGQLNHTHIVQVYDVQRDEAADVWFISMEYASAGSIKDVLSAEGVLPLDHAISVITDAARGLAYAEQKGIVHRDIKPDNLMVTADGAVKIGDLGLASAAGEQVVVPAAEAGTGPEGATPARAARVFGTPHYIAPEQAQGKPVDHRADLYALGGTFFRIVTGRPPYEGKTAREIVKKHVTEPTPSVQEAAPQIPRAVARIIERLLEKRPEDRYQSASELVRDLEAISRSQSRGASRVAVAIVAIAAIAVTAWGLSTLVGGPPPDDGGEVVVVPPQGDGEEQTGDDPQNPDVDRSTDTGPSIVGGGEETDTGPEREAAAALNEVGDRELSAELMGEALAQAFDAVALAHPGTRAAAEAEHRAGKVRKIIGDAEAERASVATRNEQGRAALAEALRESADLISQRRYGQAIERLSLVEEEHRSSVAGREATPGYIALYHERARDDLEDTKGRASSLASSREWDSALAELQRVVELFGLPDCESEALQLVRSIERERVRVRDAEREAQLERDLERMKEIDSLVARKLALDSHDHAAAAQVIEGLVSALENPEILLRAQARASDHRSAAALLDEMTARYDRKDGFRTRSFPTPASKRAGMGQSISFTVPGKSGHTSSDGRSFKIVFKRGDAEPVTSLMISDFSPGELVTTIELLWELTPLEQLSLAALAAREGAVGESARLLDALDRAALTPVEVEHADDLRRRLESSGDLIREVAAGDLYKLAIASLGEDDHQAALDALQKLVEEYPDTQAIREHSPPQATGEDSIPSLIARCRKAIDMTVSPDGARYVIQVVWQTERKNALAAASDYLETLEKGRQLLPLARVQKRLESFDDAARTYTRYEKEMRGSKDGEITSGRIYVRLAECAHYLKDERSVAALLEKARQSPEPDQGAIKEFTAFRAGFDAAWERAQELIDQRSREKSLSLKDQRELVNLFRRQLRLEIAYRAEVLNLLRNYSQQVDAGVYTWEVIDSYWDTGDYRSVRGLAPQFIQDHPASQATTSGEASWRAAESLRKLGDEKRAIHYYKLIEEIAPTADRVTNGTVAGRIKMCEKKLR